MVDIKTVGVIGAGQMGTGIAQVSALAGYDVVVSDVTLERTESALATINGHMARQIAKGTITEAERRAALARITPAKSLEAMGNCDIIIEAATENEAVKRQIFESLKPHLKQDAIVGSNTSSISITRLAAITDRAGTLHRHPFHESGAAHAARRADPRHRDRNDETFEATREFCGKLGKTVTVSEDFPAFIVNRILLPMINEAIYTLYEGVGSVDAIDTAMRLGANHPMGPLQLADFIGLDTCLSVMQVLYEGLPIRNTGPARCS